VSANPEAVMYSAARMLQFQTPPYERPAAAAVLMVCRRDDDGLPSDIWEFPHVGEFEYPAKLEPWTAGVLLARVDGQFDPPGFPAEDFNWVSADFVRTCTALHPDVPAALRRLEGSTILDQILARIGAASNSSTSTGDVSTMGTSTASRSDFAAAQIKANRVANAYGDSAPAPLVGESLLDYRARLATQYKRFSKAFQNSDLHKIGDASAMSGIEDAIYNDAMTEATHPTAASLKPGQLRAITTMDASNRPITRYAGDISAFMDQFNPPHRYITRFNTPGRS
jgi:hypothetical protein